MEWHVIGMGFGSSEGWARSLLIAAVFVLAGLVKGIVGLGLPTVAMGVLSLMMPPAQAAAWLIVPSLLTNVWQMRPFGEAKVLARRTAGLLVGIGVGLLVGAWLLGGPGAAWTEALLGAVLVGYGAWGIFGRPISLSHSRAARLGPIAGLTTGVLTSLTGVFVVPAVPYLQSLGFSRDHLIQAMGIAFTVATVALAVGLAVNGQYSLQAAGASSLMLLPALLGMSIGQGLRRLLSPTVFRMCFFGSLILLGAYMMVQYFG